MDLSKRLIITRPMYFSEDSEKCGYCKGVKEEESQFYSIASWDEGDGKKPHHNCTVGFQCEAISIEMYDKLCNNGFRRSGKFLYKPDLLRSCCRLFTIRTTPEQVVITKELKRCVKRFAKNADVTLSSPPKKPAAGFNYVDILDEIHDQSSKFHSKFEPAVYTEEKYELFARYQEQIHDDFKHTKHGFQRFLCDSPFSAEVVQGTQEEWDSLNSGKNPHRLGPAHECYYFEDKLIAIAVLDFMPSGISSVYFIWDPDFKHWSLGKLSALRELNLLKNMKLSYYYLGYYVDDCHKMEYKANYGGELLDIVNLQYVPLKFLKHRKIMDGGKLFVMSDRPEDDMSELDMMNLRLKKMGVTAFQSMTNTDGVVNVAENIYGRHPQQGAYANLPQVIEKLQEYGIKYTLDPRGNVLQFKPNEKESNSEAEIYDEDDERLQFPNVVPGLVSLEELLRMVEDNKLDELNGNLFLFDISIQRIRPVFDILEESPYLLTMICNLVRVLGLEMAKQCLVILA